MSPLQLQRGRLLPINRGGTTFLTSSDFCRRAFVFLAELFRTRFLMKASQRQRLTPLAACGGFARLPRCAPSPPPHFSYPVIKFIFTRLLHFLFFLCSCKERNKETTPAARRFLAMLISGAFCAGKMPNYHRSPACFNFIKNLNLPKAHTSCQVLLLIAVA